MEDHKLKIFCTLVETKSFSKTSKIVHLTQPAVTLQIQALEELYETKLFNRSSGDITLTPAGEILYKYAKQILSLYKEVKKEIDKLTGLAKGDIKIGTGTTIGNYVLPEIIADFKKKYPQVKICVFIDNKENILKMLKTNTINFGIVSILPEKDEFIVSSKISDELCVVCPPDHPFTAKKVISIYELIKEPFILREEGSSTRNVFEKLLAKYGINISDLHISLILSSTTSIKEAIEKKLGLSILSKLAIRKELKYKSLSIVKLKECKIIRNFYIIYPKITTLPYIVEEFINHIKNFSFFF